MAYCPEMYNPLRFATVVALILLTSICSASETTSTPVLDLSQANRLAALPVACIQQPFPYKSGHILAQESDLALPREHHPAFYGCFDWHSAVHGHWSLVYLLKTFSGLQSEAEIRRMLSENLTAENIATEIDYFSLNAETGTFERTYGWAWLLKLSEELETWNDEDARIWATNLRPLAHLVRDKIVEYLPKLVYPIRVGEHTNTAFGLNFAYDYALTLGDADLQQAIATRAHDFYFADAECPLSWEPSGHDFLSPCLQELDLMGKILDTDAFATWATQFLPTLSEGDLPLTPGQVLDRSDGKLVHLDGLNFSRAWNLYPLTRTQPDLLAVADHHLLHSLDTITDGEYSGGHWLASFALYALKTRQEVVDHD